MATSTYPTMTGAVGSSDIDVFIPELWSDEVLASFQSNLVISDLCTKMDHRGRKGDTIRVPAPYRGGTNSKAENTAVTLQNATEEQIVISIDQHWEYSRLIEDFASVQALGSARSFYTADAGYQMAKTHDQFMALQWGRWNAGDISSSNDVWNSKAYIGSDGTTAFDPTASTNTGNGAALADAGIRAIIQKLDDNDVPLSDRVLVIPPVAKATLLGLARFTEQAYTGEAGAGNSIRNGYVGDVYGVKVYVTTACPVIHVNSTAGLTSTTFSTTTPSGTTGDAFGDFGLSADTVAWGAGSDTKYRVCSMFHKSGLVMVQQAGVRAQTQYKQEYLADLFTVDSVFGGMGVRTGAASSGETATAGYNLIVPA